MHILKLWNFYRTMITYFSKYEYFSTPLYACHMLLYSTAVAVNGLWLFLSWQQQQQLSLSVSLPKLAASRQSTKQKLWIVIRRNTWMCMHVCICIYICVDIFAFHSRRYPRIYYECGSVASTRNIMWHSHALLLLNFCLKPQRCRVQACREMHVSVCVGARVTSAFTRLRTTQQSGDTHLGSHLSNFLQQVERQVVHKNFHIVLLWRYARICCMYVYVCVCVSMQKNWRAHLQHLWRVSVTAVIMPLTAALIYMSFNCVSVCVCISVLEKH